MKRRGLIPGSLPQKLVQRAFSKGAVKSLVKSMKGYEVDEVNCVGYKSVVKGLIMLYLEGFPVNRMPGFEVIVDCVAEIFEGNSLLAMQFWQHDFKDAEKRSVLDTARSRFPIKFGELTRLIVALCACEKSSESVFDWFSELPTFTVVVSRFDVDVARLPSGGLGSASGECTWLNSASGLVKGSRIGNINIPERTPGNIVGVDPLVAQMKHTYSGWHLFIYIIDAYLSAQDGEIKDGPTVDDVVSILNLYQAYFNVCGRVGFELLLDHCAKAGVDRTHIISSVTRILGRCCVGGDGMQMMTVCIGVVGVMLESYADVVWRDLRGATLFPSYVVEDGVIRGRDGDGYLTGVVVGYERQRGVYPCLIAFLGLVRRMVGELVKGGGGRRNGVRDCIVFCCVEVFNGFLGWRYVDLKEKYVIAGVVIEIFNCVLGSCVAEVKEVKAYLVASFLDGNSIHPLLELVGIGNAMPESFYRSMRGSEARTVEKCIVSSLMFLRDLLIEGRGCERLEHVILERGTRGGKKEEIVNVIAKYIEYDYSLDIPIFATHVLTLLARGGQRGFIGYFGEAGRIVRGFVGIAGQSVGKGVNADGREVLCEAVFKFVCVVLESQPGLGMLFLNGAGEGNEIVSAEAGKESMVNVVLKHLGDVDGILKARPRLGMSVFGLLRTLWDCEDVYGRVVGVISSNEVFWSALRNVLLAANPVPVEGGVTEYCQRAAMAGNALHIVARHLLYVTPRDQPPVKQLMDIVKNVFYEGKIGSNILRDCQVDDVGDVVNKVRSFAEGLFIGADLEDCRLAYSSGPEYTFQKDVGKNYRYDMDIVEARYGVEFAERVGELNCLLSVADEKIALLGSYRLLLRAFSVRLGVKAWMVIENSTPGAGDVKRLFGFVDKVLEVMQEEGGNSGYVSVGYRNELSGVLVGLVRSWKSVFVNGSDWEGAGGIVKRIERCLSNDSFPVVGADGRSSDMEFHRGLFACLLVLLKNGSGEGIEAAVLDVFPIVCETLVSLLSKVMVKGMEIESLRYLQLMIMLVVEMVMVCSKASGDAWLVVMEKQDVIPEVLGFLAQCLDIAAVDAVGATIARDVLHLVLVLSGSEPSAERLAVHGCLSLFSNNSLTPLLEAGGVEGDVHGIWCLMLSVVDCMLRTMGTSAALVMGVDAFLSMYERQVEGAMDVTGEPMLGVDVLSEVECITRVFDAFGGDGCKVVERYLGSARGVLKYYGFLMLHPGLLDEKSGGVKGIKERLIKSCRGIIGCALKASDVSLVGLMM